MLFFVNSTAMNAAQNTMRVEEVKTPLTTPIAEDFGDEIPEARELNTPDIANRVSQLLVVSIERVEALAEALKYPADAEEKPDDIRQQLIESLKKLGGLMLHFQKKYINFEKVRDDQTEGCFQNLKGMLGSFGIDVETRELTIPCLETESDVSALKEKLMTVRSWIAIAQKMAEVRGL